MVQRHRLVRLLFLTFLFTTFTAAWPWPPSFENVEALVRRQEKSKDAGVYILFFLQLAIPCHANRLQRHPTAHPLLLKKLQLSHPKMLQQQLRKRELQGLRLLQVQQKKRRRPQKQVKSHLRLLKLTINHLQEQL